MSKGKPDPPYLPELMAVRAAKRSGKSSREERARKALARALARDNERTGSL